MHQTTDLGRSLTIKQFCELEQLSPSTFYKMRRDGYAPEELRVPNSEVVRFTPEAILAWRERMIKLGQTEQAELERQRRVAQRRAAGVASSRKRRRLKRLKEELKRPAPKATPHE